MPRITNLLFAGVVCTAIAMIFIVVVRKSLRDDSHALRDVVYQGVQPSDDPVTVYPVMVRTPTGPPRIELAGTDPQGRSGSVACSTCHAVRKPNVENVSAATLDEFHLGMTFSHGKITCYACHNPDDTDSLRLADGTAVSYVNVMTLCSQCHGSQSTAFAHGAHGGMNGHWDLTRGPQMKNNCIDCHDPHLPNYPKMVVEFKPKDRFNAPPEHDHEGADSHDDH